MITQLETNILNACKTLFGQETRVSPQFLLSLKPNLLKTVFRKRALETHPDFFSDRGAFVQRKQTEMFQVVNEAYRIMRSYCERRDRDRSFRHYPAAAAAAAAAKSADTASGPRPALPVHDSGLRYRGPVPERPLEIGRYLYYRGRIPYHILLKAVQWQMRQRPSVGAIARRWGWLDDRSVYAILSFRGTQRLFCQRALHIGALSSYQVRTLLGYQRTLQKKLGQYFVEHGHIPLGEMEQLAADHSRHNARFPYSAIAAWRAS
jgi:hypothetical protein